MYEDDSRTVMTLDAGGTNFVFSAIRGCKEIVSPVRIDAVNDDISGCLETIADGFRLIEKELGAKADAISFAFPGPADYKAGIIGDCPNFPAFRGGVPLGPYLSGIFKIPVYINNDGNLFALGEALAGTLPKINGELAAAGSRRRFNNLIGVTLGTGFGCGVVIGGELLTGDNGSGGDLWLMRNRKYPDLIAEESVSIRAVKRVYHENAPEDKREVSPLDIFNIAEGTAEGSQHAAQTAFIELGTAAADAIANALDIVDGLVVIGGGISGAGKYFLPPLVKELGASLRTFSGDSFPLTEMKVFNLEDAEQHAKFLSDSTIMLPVPGSGEKVPYDTDCKSGVCISSLGASRAVYLGAYAFALSQMDKN